MSPSERDQLISSIADRWGLVAPYLANASDAGREAGPATLYLIAICSACAANIEPESAASPRMTKPPWAAAVLDAAAMCPHERLKRAVSHSGTTHRVIAAAQRLGSQSVRILAGNSEPYLAFKQCIHGLGLAAEVGSWFDEAFLRQVETADPKWRRLPVWVLRRMAGHVRSRRGAPDRTEVLAMEISLVVDALEHAQCDLGTLAKNVGWPGIVSRASYREWSSSLAAYCDSGYEIRPLLNSTELQDESKAMQNCVKEYDLLCAGDIARVFSIRHVASRTRVASALLTRDDEDVLWELDQVRGPHNHPVHPAIHDLANRIADFYSQSEPNTSSFDDLGTNDKAAAKLARMSSVRLVID